jgi:hypothetical protein
MGKGPGSEALMVLLDSNIFIIDRFYRKDDLYPSNRTFIERLQEFESGVSIFTLLEAAGVASFNLSPRECEQWLLRFPSIYPVAILSASGLAEKNADEWMKKFVEEVATNITKRMSFGDAVLLREAESLEVEAIVTWNTKDFAKRTLRPVLTPTAFLRKLPRLAE